MSILNFGMFLNGASLWEQNSSKRGSRFGDLGNTSYIMYLLKICQNAVGPLLNLKYPVLSTHEHQWVQLISMFPVKQRQPTADIDAHNEQESADLSTDSIPTCRRIRNYTGDILVLFVSMWKKLTWNSKPTFPNTTSLVLRSFVINRKVQIRSFCCKGIVGCSTPGPATRRDP